MAATDEKDQDPRQPQTDSPDPRGDMSVATEQAILPWETPVGEPMAVASTLPGKETLIAMNDTIEATELKDKPARIVHVIVHNATVRDDESGIETEVRRTVLIDTKGVAYACVSDGVISSLQQLAAVFGPPPWNDVDGSKGLPLRMIEKQTRRGFRTYRLIPA